MKIDVLTLFPEMFEQVLTTSILKRATDKGAVKYNLVNIRDHALNKHNKVDDYPYGGGQGMVLMCQPVVDAIRSVKTEDSLVVMMTPQGVRFDQKLAGKFSREVKHLILVCGHYEGFDERIRDYVDMEVSIGDYVLTGGEIASMVIIDAVSRLLGDTINPKSHMEDSFQNDLLDHAQYTKPRVFEGKAVPEVLLSGHHKNIENYRKQNSLEKTMNRRPDLLDKDE